MEGLDGFLVYLLGGFVALLVMSTIGRVWYNQTPSMFWRDGAGMLLLLFLTSWAGAASVLIVFIIRQCCERSWGDSYWLVRERKWFWEE